MKLRRLSKCLIAGFLCMLPLMSLEAAGTEYGADNPEVMGKIVRSRMLPIAMTAPHDTGTLLFSDSPEYADKDGILYVDKVKGDTRLYFYHVNQANYPRKIVVMAYNPSTSEVSAGVSGVYYAKPSTSYYDVGKDLSTLYYEGNATYNRVSVPPVGYAILSDRLNRVIVAPDQLFSGIVNMDLPEDMYVSAVIMPAAADPVTFMKKQQYLASDAVKLRGTFPGMDRYLKNLIPFTTEEGIGYVLIADGIQDRFLRGYDAIDDRLSEDVGNYGLDYIIQIKTRGTGLLHYYFNTQGGEYAGVAEISYDDGKGGTTSKIVELPRKGLSMGFDNAYAMEYLDSVAAGTTVTIHLMPPGAANLPVRILIVPDASVQQAADAVHEEEQRRLEDEKQKQQQGSIEDDWTRIEKKLHAGRTEEKAEPAGKKTKQKVKEEKKTKAKKNKAPVQEDRGQGA